MKLMKLNQYRSLLNVSIKKKTGVTWPNGYFIIARLIRNRYMPVSREFEPNQSISLVSLNKKLYARRSVIVAFRKRIRE